MEAIIVFRIDNEVSNFYLTSLIGISLPLYLFLFSHLKLHKFTTPAVILIEKSATSLSLFYEVWRLFLLCHKTRCILKPSRPCENAIYLNRTFKSRPKTYLVFGQAMVL